MPRSGRRQSIFDPEWVMPTLDEERGYTVSSIAELGDEDEPTVKQPVKNTYQLAPYLPFDPKAATLMLQETLQQRLHDVTYDAVDAIKYASLVKSLSDEIKEQAKVMHCDRFRCVAMVSIGQKNGQGYVSGSRCLYDASCDHRAMASFCNRSLFAKATLFAIYKD